MSNYTPNHKISAIPGKSFVKGGTDFSEKSACDLDQDNTSVTHGNKGILSSIGEDKKRRVIDITRSSMQTDRVINTSKKMATRTNNFETLNLNSSRENIPGGDKGQVFNNPLIPSMHI